MPVSFKRNMPIASDLLNELRSASWGGPQTGNWASVLAHSLGWVCATDHDQLVGFVNVAWDGGIHAFILDTTVHREYQRRGIGAALVREAASLARDHGVEWLHVDYEDELKPFYQSCGFRPTAAGLFNLQTSATTQSDSNLGGV